MPGKQGRSTNWLTVMMGGKNALPEMSLNNDLTQRMAKNNDIAIITIGRNSGEGADRKAEEAILSSLRRKGAHKPYRKHFTEKESRCYFEYWRCHRNCKLE